MSDEPYSLASTIVMELLWHIQEVASSTFMFLNFVSARINFGDNLSFKV